LFEATNSTPTHAVIIKGEGGRDFLSEALSSHNIQVTTVDCYRRTWPVISADDLRQAVSLDEPSVVHVASGETLQRLSQLCLEQDLQVLNVHRIVVPSQRVAETAKELGWQSRIVAEGASDEALLRVIAQLP
jgi:uroporphyrinogen-III synthase